MWDEITYPFVYFNGATVSKSKSKSKKILFIVGTL